MMLDIIIPAYNAKETIFRTLSSIAIQRNAPSFQVTLVNDCSLYDYQEFVSYFSSFFKIQEIKTDSNGGPGFARKIGLLHTNADYIVFIDSDDIFYTPYSLSILFEEISKNSYDLVVSNFLYERDDVSIVKEKDAIWLHGKIYSRSFLEKYSITFNDTRSNEDNGFNRLILLLHPKISYISDITYEYCENPDSITRRDNRRYRLMGLEGYINNMIWSIEEALKRNAKITDISFLCLGILVSMYFYYLEMMNDDEVTLVLKWSKPILFLYHKHCSSPFSDKHAIQSFISLNQEDYQKEKKELDYSLSFSDFIHKVGDYHD